jgi:hypothetical protein
VDGAEQAGFHTSITIGVDGLALVAYHEPLNEELRVAHCSNRFCTPYVRPR